VADRDLGEGTRLAALTGAYVSGQALRPKKGPYLGASRAHPRRPGLRECRPAVGGRDGLPQARPAGTLLLPPARPPQAQGRAVEGAWSVMKSDLGNHAARTLNELEAIVRGRLRQIQRRPELINALLGRTGPTLDPPP